MTWVKLDDHFDQHPKLQAVGPLGVALWVAGLAYCNRNLTDGFIPWTTARSLLAWEYLGVPEEDGRRKRYRVSRSSGIVGDDIDAEHVIELLIVADLWDETDDGYVVHDYDKYQPSREEVERDRQSARERMGAVRKNKPRNSGEVRANNGRSSTAPVPDPVPVPKKAAAAAAARAREDDPPPTTFDGNDANTRCYRAFMNQFPGGFNGTIRDHIDGLLEGGLAPEVIEEACRISAEEGGNKGWAFVSAVIRRLSSGQSKRTKTLTGPDGRTFASGLEIVKTGGRIIDVEVV